MAFAIGQTVIYVKLTDTGRELLSRGQLTFTQFGLGDSEINYQFNDKINFDPFNANILRPLDKNPEIVSFITRVETGSTLNPLGDIVSNTSVITNTAPERGLFTVTTASTTILSDPGHAKQGDIKIGISGVTGGSIVTLNQAPTYGSSPNEPEVGDYLMVKWANPLITGGTVTFDVNQVVPYLWYKIQNIISGSLLNNDLIVEVDRDLPNFNGQGDGIFAGALVYPNNNGRLISGDSIQNYYGEPFITDFLSEAVFTFLENCDVPTIDVPVWNMSIVFTEEIAGVFSTNRNFSQYFSAPFGGFVQYIQQLDPTIKNIGLIHYTNLSPSNNYGEGLNESTPILELPTIMWHKQTGGTIGLTLTADTTSKALLPNLNTEYFNLVDSFGNIVGKVFNDLKIFVIEDQELLFAMSYKSNRNWTLPVLGAGINLAICPDP